MISKKIIRAIKQRERRYNKLLYNISSEDQLQFLTIYDMNVHFKIFQYLKKDKIKLALQLYNNMDLETVKTLPLVILDFLLNKNWYSNGGDVS